MSPKQVPGNVGSKCEYKCTWRTMADQLAASGTETGRSEEESERQTEREVLYGADQCGNKSQREVERGEKAAVQLHMRVAVPTGRR